MLNLTGEESNYEVLIRVCKALYDLEGEKRQVVEEAMDFVRSKQPIMDEIEELRIKARRGDNQAAKDLISKLVEFHDGA